MWGFLKRRRRVRMCECGHPINEHAWSGYGPHTVCVEMLDDPDDGWYGVCPCVRRP